MTYVLLGIGIGVACTLIGYGTAALIFISPKDRHRGDKK